MENARKLLKEISKYRYVGIGGFKTKKLPTAFTKARRLPDDRYSPQRVGHGVVDEREVFQFGQVPQLAEEFIYVPGVLLHWLCAKGIGSTVR